MLNINLRNLRTSHQTLWFALDMLMLVLLVINLVWLLFDSLYAVVVLRDLLTQQMPAFTAFYNPIHRHFLFYDLMFIGIFLSEFAVRWVHAAYRREYQRWYFYPIAHWYDLLGCIPASGARVLRFLRVFSIVYRLQKYGVIDITNTRLFEFLRFYYDAFMEELSDRVVIKVLSGTQEEVKRGSPLVRRVQEEVLLPRRDLLVDFLSARITRYAREGYMPRQQELRAYLNARVISAMNRNRDLGRIRELPVFGSWASGTLDRAVGDITAEVIEQILNDLSSPDNHNFVEDLVDVLLTPHERENSEANTAVIQGVIETLELVKDQVAVKRWQEALAEKDEQKAADRATQQEQKAST
ncbi:ion transporter [Halovibrio salipaludis]|uniref:ion transporter n=1 Tax=Halovibrio salipaludis TaxID=2032626 RepID=UPI0018EA1E48|nr:ion transporter [Halovibrio salipaludis]